MKRIILLLFCLLNFNLYAQNLTLTEEDWFIRTLTMDGITYENPHLHDSFGYTLFLTSSMASSMCESGGIICNYQINDEESSIEFSGLELFEGDCVNDESIQFKNTYFDFFEQGISEAFQYSIITLDDESANLILTDTNGNEAVYTNAYMLPAPELTSETWYLQNLVIDGEENIPPVNDEVPLVSLELENNSLASHVCAPMFAATDFDAENLRFYIYDPSFGATDCEDYENNTYQYLYFGFFQNNYFDYFHYSVTENSEGTKTLIITDHEGNQAIYGSSMMNSADVSQKTYLIYPNPVKDKLVIENPGTKNAKIKVSDSSGKLIMTKEISSVKTEIDLGGLPKGIYFISIESNGKTGKTEKFIKD